VKFFEICYSFCGQPAPHGKNMVRNMFNVSPPGATTPLILKYLISPATKGARKKE